MLEDLAPVIRYLPSNPGASFAGVSRVFGLDEFSVRGTAAEEGIEREAFEPAPRRDESHYATPARRATRAARRRGGRSRRG